MPEPREEIASGLAGALSEEQVRYLVDEILAAKKVTWVSCGYCKKKSQVEVPDAKAVAMALPPLLDQAFGKRGQTESEQGERIVFTRVVTYAGKAPGEPVEPDAAAGDVPSV